MRCKNHRVTLRQCAGTLHAFAAILPLVIVGILLEKYIIKGMAAGATKG